MNRLLVALLSILIILSLGIFIVIASFLAGNKDAGLVDDKCLRLLGEVGLGKIDVLSIYNINGTVSIEISGNRTIYVETPGLGERSYLEDIIWCRFDDG